MNKFTKISAAALFAFFLTACDKPAPKADAAKAEATPAAQQAAPQQAAPATVQVDQQGIADFQKIVEWNKAQEEALGASQAKLTEALESRDQAKVEEQLKAFTAKVDEVLKSLDSVDVKNEAVAQFKAKTKETLMLSSDLIAESVKTMEKPTAEAQKLVQEKSQVLIKAGQELQVMQQQLHQLFMPAPAATPAEQPAK